MAAGNTAHAPLVRQLTKERRQALAQLAFEREFLPPEAPGAAGRARAVLPTFLDALPMPAPAAAVRAPGAPAGGASPQPQQQPAAGHGQPTAADLAMQLVQQLRQQPRVQPSATEYASNTGAAAAGARLRQAPGASSDEAGADHARLWPPASVAPSGLQHALSESTTTSDSDSLAGILREAREAVALMPQLAASTAELSSQLEEVMAAQLAGDDGGAELDEEGSMPGASISVQSSRADSLGSLADILRQVSERVLNAGHACTRNGRAGCTLVLQALPVCVRFQQWPAIRPLKERELLLSRRPKS